MNKKPSILLLLLCLCWGASTAFPANENLTDDTWWLDSAGNPIYAQSGGISKFGSTYYWYGVQYAGASSYYSTGTANSDTLFVAINCYTSTDLVHWTFANASVTTSTPGFSFPGASDPTSASDFGWVSRMGSVLYNSSSKLYVMWVQYDGDDGVGMACLTCSTPTGNFVINNVQTSIGNVYHNIEGDSTIFCDVDHGSTPYLIFSDSHGREHAYISPLSSNYETIESATLISEWPQGQEANNMFCRNGIYYYIMSNTAGWSYSSAYAVWSSSILTPSDYTADAAFAGTTADYTHHSQVSFGIEIEGTSQTSYVMAGDRWADFDDTYKNAGFGSGYYEWSPITFSGNTPTYNSLSKGGTLGINAATGALTW
jgi:hypothetical protein